MISILLSYSLIIAAKSVDDVKYNMDNNRKSLLEDNLIMWRLFPSKVLKSFPDLVKYLKEILINKDYSAVES
jgi:hypothetical protein